MQQFQNVTHNFYNVSTFHLSQNAWSELTIAENNTESINNLWAYVSSVSTIAYETYKDVKSLAYSMGNNCT